MSKLKAKPKAVATKKPATPKIEIPKGFWLDAAGRLTHESLVTEVDRARDALVKQLIATGKEQSVQLSNFKSTAMASISDFVEASAASYDVKLGGKKGNVTLFSYDGQYKVIRAVQDRMEFDERLQAARALIDECLADWSKNARYELKAIVNRAFDVDAEGKINVGKVLELRRVDIKDERWQRAMKALGESLQVVSSKSYIRMYERDSAGAYQPIPLDVAGA